MQKINHVSFDVWNTLVKPNPSFAIARNQMISDMLGVSVGFVKEQYTETKRHLDALAYQHGLGCYTQQAWQQLIEKLSLWVDNDVSKNWDSRQLVVDMKYNMVGLFLDHSPIVDEATIKAVRDLHNAGITMNIASNSNFVPGCSMRLFLDTVFGTPDKFKFFVFSDESGVAKPSFQFFQRVRSQISSDTGIIHVGDDDKYDHGAKQVGIEVVIVNEQYTVPQLVKNILEGNRT